MEPEKRKLFKDWFDLQAARQMAIQIAAVWPEFPSQRFIKLATTRLHELEFHARVECFARALYATLPPPPKSLHILHSSLPPPLEKETGITGNWLQWPVGWFVATYGLPHFEESFALMESLTQCFTAEFAVRPFVRDYQDKTLAALLERVSHPNPHVRRWCSEGTRPRLPWGEKLTALATDPRPALPILEALKDDPSEYVRKSVANHLNDISREHPQLVLGIARRWLKRAGKNRRRTVERALRSLLKAGDPDAMALLGFNPTDDLALRLKLSPKKVVIGSDLLLQATITNPANAAQKVCLDYVLGFEGAEGRPRQKVFRWKSFTLAAGETLQLQKKQSLRNVSGRTWQPGKAIISLQANGLKSAAATFHLTTPAK